MNMSTIHDINALRVLDFLTKLMLAWWDGLGDVARHQRWRRSRCENVNNMSEWWAELAWCMHFKLCYGVTWPHMMSMPKGQ
jgi:hypothetical protein